MRQISRANGRKCRVLQRCRVLKQNERLTNQVFCAKISENHVPSQMEIEGRHNAMFQYETTRGAFMDFVIAMCLFAVAVLTCLVRIRGPPGNQPDYLVLTSKAGGRPPPAFVSTHRLARKKEKTRIRVSFLARKERFELWKFVLSLETM